jgi:hypothetical protein
MKSCLSVPLLLAFAVSLPAMAQAFSKNSFVSQAEQNPFTPKEPAKKAPADEDAAPPREAKTVPWGAAQIAAAKAKCAEVLASIAVEYEALPPLKQGLCGAPAPILVKSIGSDPKVAISPPATMTCALAVGVEAWLRTKVQPEAAKMFGSPVVTLRNAASYACRKRNNSARGILSEHALANALDISEFIFASGERVAVLTSWPRVAVSVAEAPELPEPNPARLDEATGAVPPREAPPPAKPPPAPVSHVRVVGNVTEATKVNPFVFATPSPGPELSAPPALPVIEAPPQPGKPKKPPPHQKSAFVRTIYAEACKTFGTTLGPAADAAHRSHFHFDMKTRRSGYCR